MITPAWFFSASLSLFSSRKTTASAGVGSACLGLLVAPPAVARPKKRQLKGGRKEKKRGRESPPRSDSDGRGSLGGIQGGWFPTIRSGGTIASFGGFFCVVNRLLSVESHRLSQTVHSSSSSQTDTKGSDVRDQRGSTAPQHKKSTEESDPSERGCECDEIKTNELRPPPFSIKIRFRSAVWLVGPHRV